MSRRFLAREAVLVCTAFLLFGLGTTSTPAESDKDLFGMTRVWSIHLEISAKEYAAMQPPAPAGFGFPGAKPAPPLPEISATASGTCSAPNSPGRRAS